MIKLRKFRREDTKAVALLVRNTYKQFNSAEFIKKSAVQEYLDHYDPKKNTIQQIYENFQRTPIFYVAVLKNKGKPDSFPISSTSQSAHGMNFKNNASRSVNKPQAHDGNNVDKIIGMIRGRPDRIANLFVDGKHHKKGIGRMLVNKFESEAKKQKSKEIKIRASLYATMFYQKMGYKKTTGIRNFRGLKVYPMKKLLYVS